MYCTGKTCSNTVSVECTVWYDMYIVHCTLYIVHCTVYVVHTPFPCPELHVKCDNYRYPIQNILPGMTFTDTLSRLYVLSVVTFTDTLFRVYDILCTQCTDTLSSVLGMYDIFRHQYTLHLHNTQSHCIAIFLTPDSYSNWVEGIPLQL